jgi:hypothetical protein
MVRRIEENLKATKLRQESYETRGANLYSLRLETTYT